MQEVDGKEHEVAGCDVGRESTGGDSHVTVRLHFQLLEAPSGGSKPRGFTFFFCERQISVKLGHILIVVHSGTLL